jgi:hypothetical protein
VSEEFMTYVSTLKQLEYPQLLMRLENLEVEKALFQLDLERYKERRITRFRGSTHGT